MSLIKITYNNQIDLRYQLRDTDLADRWLKRLQLALDTDIAIDEPTRFSGFDTTEAESVISQLQHCVDTINTYKPLIARHITTVDDQDTLNYLHHVFEVYHGMLNQPHEIFLSAPQPVQMALANLNVLVHRAETVAQGKLPRHVVTYYAMPKTEYLKSEDYALFEKSITAGTMYINYVEIGKDLLALALDNDQYISDSAFMPWQRYSADFNVKFWSDSKEDIQHLTRKVNQYYQCNSEFLDQYVHSQVWGYLPVADCIDKFDIEQLSNNQRVTAVNVI